MLKVKVNGTSTIGLFLTLGLLLGGEYRLIGYVGFFGTLVLLFFLNGITVKRNAINGMFLRLSVLVVIMTAYAMFNGMPGSFAVGDAFRYYLVFCVAFFSYNSKLSSEDIEGIINTFVYSFLVLLLCCYVQVGFDIHIIESNTLVTTQIGADIFLVICALLYKKVKTCKTVVTIMFLLVIQYIAESRTALISSIMCLVLYFVFNKIIKNGRWVFWGWTFVCSMIPVLYVLIWKWSFCTTIELFFLKYTGHRFFSGRQFIWERAFEKIYESPIFGQGVGFRLDTTNLYQGASEGMSVHNLFLYIILQLGLLGLALFCFLFYRLWKEYSFEYSKQKNCMKAFLLSLLLQQTFSLGLVSGKMGYAVVSWFLLMIGAKEHSG